MTNLQSGAPQHQKRVSADSLLYEFSPEEKNVMDECNRESFYQRSLPLSIIASFGSFIAVNSGYLKPNLKWGPWPKVIAGGLLGYIIGKYSYQNICAEKLMQLPNSEIGRVLRERRGKKINESFEGNIMIPTITTGTLIDDPTFSTDYKSDIDIDMHVPTNTLDTDYRPNFDGLYANKGNEIPSPSSHNIPTSYDELRARNRQDYERTQPNRPIYRQPPLSSTQPIWDNQPNLPADQRTPQPKESRNQYGDVFN